MIKIQVIYDTKVPKWIRDVHITFSNWLAANYSIPTRLNVYLYPEVVLKFDALRFWGYFNPSYKYPRIGLACGRPRIDGKFPSQDDQIDHFLHTFAHEFVHYERWRDNKPQNHRGVENRAHGLVNKFHKYLTTLESVV